MTEVKSFLSDLDDAVARGTAESRKRALWHATDLLIAGRYSDDEIWTFGEVIGRLADEIEVAARAQLAKRLATFDNAPINIIHKLAFDDSIDVAGPVLQESGQLGLRRDIPRRVFQQLIAKASEDVKRRLERERPGIVDQIQTSVTDVTGALQSKFGPVSRSYFVAKRLVATQHQQGNLNENSISGYARFHRFEEVTIRLSLLCSLAADVIERALADKNREMLWVLAKALDFSWQTTMS